MLHAVPKLGKSNAFWSTGEAHSKAQAGLLACVLICSMHLHQLYNYLFLLCTATLHTMLASGHPTVVFCVVTWAGPTFMHVCRMHET